MDGYTLTEKLKKTRLWYKLNVYEQLIYHELISVCNDKRWEEIFQCSNASLCKSLNISEKTLVKSRNSLINAGLIFYQSGKNERRKGSYSFTTPFDTVPHTDDTVPHTDVTTVPHTDDTVPDTDGDTVPHTDVTTVPAPDNKDKTKYKTPPLSPKESESERRTNPLTISFDEISNNLLTDETWKEQTAMQSGLSIKFLNILPKQINLFLQYIIATGEEHTILTLSDAKRRFFWWWKNYGKYDYEKEQSNSQIIVW